MYVCVQHAGVCVAKGERQKAGEGEDDIIETRIRPPCAIPALARARFLPELCNRRTTPTLPVVPVAPVGSGLGLGLGLLV